LLKLKQKRQVIINTVGVEKITAAVAVGNRLPGAFCRVGINVDNEHRADWQVAEKQPHTAELPNPGTYQILMALYWYNKTKIVNQSKCK
jgi:hypothetical protein